MPTKQTPQQLLIKVILKIIYADNWQSHVPSAGDIIELLEDLGAEPSYELIARIEGISDGKRQGICGVILTKQLHPELFD